MLKNHFKIAWRKLIKHKAFSVLNILGLSFGLLSSLLICLWIMDELSVNKNHENIESLYSVYERVYMNGEVTGIYKTPAHLYRELKLKIPEIEKSTVVTPAYEKTFANKSKAFKQSGTFTNQDYFSLFSFKFIQGNALTALSGPDKVVISKQMAEIFFGSAQEAIGQSLRYEDAKEFQISAIYEKTSKTTVDDYDFFLPWELFCTENPWTAQWNNNYPNTIVKLVDQMDMGVVEPKIKDFLKDYHPSISDEFNIELHLQPYAEKYLYADFENGMICGGRIENVRIFGLVAFFILLLACINFMNLASVSSLKRAKEVGVKKVFGVKNSSLVSQFLIEAILLAFISATLAILLLAIVLPSFNQLTGKDIGLLNQSWSSWLSIFVITLITGLLSGSYPAFLLSSIKPIHNLKDKSGTLLGLKSIRQGMVVFQFALSVIVICGMLITSNQINYIQNKKLGFDRHNLLTFALEGNLKGKYEVFKSRALQFPDISSVAFSSDIPLQLDNSTFSISWPGKKEDDKTTFATMVVTPDFIDTWGAKMISGRDFKNNDPARIEYILNETAVRAMGLKDPIGQSLNQWGNDGTIVGIIKDFHFETMKQAIKPLVIRNAGYIDFDQAIIRVSPDNIIQTVSKLEALHKELNPAFPFKYSFTDQEYNSLYKSEEMFFNLSQFFSWLAIFISCLGLFGLVLFTAQQKVKEIGIRKVLGASVIGITILLAKNFLRLVLLGIMIGIPVVWHLMNKWLSNYQYRVDISWYTIGTAGIITVGIALLTLSFESIRAANANPTSSLRRE